MSIEFCIKQHGENHCYSNGTIDLKSFLTTLYSNENPYDALMSLDRNNQLSDDNYTRVKRNGLVTYDIDFDRDIITRHEKGNRFKLNEMSKIPLGAAYSLLRFQGKEYYPKTISEFNEYNDMLALFGNADPDIKERGFITISNSEYFEEQLNYLKSTRGYDYIRFAKVNGIHYLAFDQHGYDNILAYLLQRLSTMHEEADRFEAEMNNAFGITTNERKVNDAFKVLSSIRINDNLEIVMGSRTTQYGTDYATWECSGGDDYYWGHYDLRTEQAAKLDMYERAAGKFRGMTAEIDTLRENSCVNFSVVSVNGDVYFSGNHIMDINIRDDPGFLELVEDSNEDIFRISVDYYCWGDKSCEASPATPEQLKAIYDNWDTEINKATLIGSNSFSVDINEDEEEDSCEFE